jgi:hypothetical protein
MPGMRYKYDHILFPSFPISSSILIRIRFDLIEDDEEKEEVEEGRGGGRKYFFSIFPFFNEIYCSSTIFLLSSF